MKAIVIIIFCLALLPSIIHGENDTQAYPLIHIVNKMADNNETINHVFQPMSGGYLGKGNFGFTFKGTLVKTKKIVAMKFTHFANGRVAEFEYEFLTCLKAINNATVESFGVPAVYYYGHWDDHVLMAITFLDTELKTKSMKNGQLNDADVLILFREFVRISKYIHGHGICHGDINMENMMFRKHQSFIIDYNYATKMYEINGPADESGKACAKTDWAKFLAAMCTLIGVEIDWGEIEDPSEIKSQIGRGALNRVYSKFADVVFDTDATVPGYNAMYQIINEEIGKCDAPKPVLVSWLSPEDRIIAANGRLPAIETINDIADMVEIHYPEPKFDFFDHNNIMNDDSAAEASTPKEENEELRLFLECFWIHD